MFFDDRLATVLRHRATGEQAARTQYRQLLDLLGSAQGNPGEQGTSMAAAAYLRLSALSDLIPASSRARIIAESGTRIRNPELVEWFAQAEPEIAASALARSALGEDQWVDLIPRLPIRARGFLRHRSDLPKGALAVLDRLGVSDRGLPEPVRSAPAPEPEADREQQREAEPALAKKGDRPRETDGAAGIGDLVRRIEAFQKARDHGGSVAASEAHTDGPREKSDPRLPLGEKTEGRLGGGFPEGRRPPLVNFSFSTDVDGRIDWADAPVAPMVVGTDLIANHASQDVDAKHGFAAAFFDRRPVRDATMALSGAQRIAGDWVVDGSPRFTQSGGHFAGYVGRFRRPPESSRQDRAAAQADRIRQLLHELRTPVNAIQGFAEVIQQQLFGATPHEYRALAAAIAGDSARMLAGFDELDRLAKLEGGVSEIETGATDIAAILRRQSEQLQTVLSPRVARLVADWALPHAVVGLAAQEAELLSWRVLATIASATGAGENIAIDLTAKEGAMRLRCVLPTTLAAAKDIFSSDTRPVGGALSPGIFGAGFALRLARAEARAVGGDLIRAGDEIVLSLPILTQDTGEAAHRHPGDTTRSELRNGTAS